MSEENLEVIGRLYRAMDAGHLEAAADLAHPDAEWVPDERVGVGPVRGRENLIRFFGDRTEMFENVRFQMERVWDVGDQVLVFVRVTGSGTGSGAEFDIRIAHLWTLSDGVVVRGEAYANRDEALEATGLSE